MRDIAKIAVIGKGECSSREAKLAYEVGKEIAERGAILLCGGLGGIMEACSKGAYEQGGMTVGILPHFSMDAANPYIKIPIATGMGHARNVIIVGSAHVVIALPGEYGTLAEIAFALKAKKPVISLNSWDIRGVAKAATPGDAVEKAFQFFRNLK